MVHSNFVLITGDSMHIQIYSKLCILELTCCDLYARSRCFLLVTYQTRKVVSPVISFIQNICVSEEYICISHVILQVLYTKKLQVNQ